MQYCYQSTYLYPTWTEDGLLTMEKWPSSPPDATFHALGNMH